MAPIVLDHIAIGARQLTVDQRVITSSGPGNTPAVRGSRC